MTFVEDVERLINEFKNREHSVQEFQFRLEWLLYSYRLISKELEEFFRQFINELELIIYTIPASEQQAQAEQVGRAVLEFIKEKGL